MRNRRGMWIAGCACAAVSVGGVFVAYAGSLDPPLGAITSSMISLEELFAQSAQAGGGITTSVLGPPRNLGALSVTGIMGPIEGEDVIEGVPGVIAVYGFSHDIAVPIDPASGQPTSVRVHSPMRIVKSIDKATPGFHKALTSGERLPDVTLRFYRTDPAGMGATQQYHTVRLTQALIVEIRPFTLAATNESYRHMEQVSMVYEEIEWTWELDGTVEMDTWVVGPTPP